LEERLRRVAGPSTLEKHDPPAPSAIARLGAANGARPASPMTNGRAGLGQVPNSPPATTSRLAQPGSPVRNAQALASNNRPSSPLRQPRIPATSQHLGSSHGPGASHLPGPSHTGIASPFTSNRPKSMLPSRLGPPRAKFAYPGRPANLPEESRAQEVISEAYEDEQRHEEVREPPTPEPHNSDLEESSDITITISSILSNDANRSVDALKKIQGILAISPEDGPSSPLYRELAEHTEGLIETITLQMAHVFERPDELIRDENWRLAKHLIQTLNTFCDHAFLAESLTVNILTSLLEELTLRLLETDDSPTPKIKDLSRFINMIILRLFAKGRRMSIFR
jgi:cytoskeleton-associated protein 5